jgi:hypothetical protein
MDSKDIKRNIPMVKLPWYGNLPNAFIQETVFCNNPEVFQPRKPWIKIAASSTENYDTVNKCLQGINLLQKNKHEKKNYRFWRFISKDSINKQLATYAAGQFENASVEVLDLNDYEMPIFSIDKETATGIPTLATDFMLNWNRRFTCNLFCRT